MTNLYLRAMDVQSRSGSWNALMITAIWKMSSRDPFLSLDEPVFSTLSISLRNLYDFPTSSWLFQAFDDEKL